MPNPAPGFVSRPDYRIDIVPDSRRVRVEFAGVTVADSTATLRLEEAGHAPVHYFPKKDVRLDLMRPTQHHSRCPYKGEASYWTIEVPGGGGARQAENAVWSYPEPYDEMLGIRDYVAFWKVDAIKVG
jgi:uncharacterized protein (DUF427 family)